MSKKAPHNQPLGETVESPHTRMLLAAAASEFWTASEMIDATPYPMPTVGPDASQLSESEETQADEEGEFIPGTLPESMTGGDGDAGDRNDTTAGGNGYDYPAPFTRFAVPPAWYSTYPYITVGKVFFKQNGVSYVGSGASIGNHAIWTAGHIVHQGNNSATGWSTDMVFVPAYRDGLAPFGKWPVSYMRTRSNWFKFGNPNGLWDDIAGGVLHLLNGKKISQVVGSLGFAHSLGRLQHWHAIGYPQGAPFDGKILIDTQASYAYDGSVAGEVKPVAIGCDMTGGCSGGPWVQGFCSKNVLNGNNSYRQSTRPLEMNSPYFDQRAKALYDELLAAAP